MVKNIHLCIDLKTVMQNDSLLRKGQCYSGIITRDDETRFRFEETLRQGRHARNPKLYDGQLVSMVRMQNGKYQMHLKPLPDNFDREGYAFRVYTEINNALQFID